jgi:hypothetical protein
MRLLLFGHHHKRSIDRILKRDVVLKGYDEWSSRGAYNPQFGLFELPRPPRSFIAAKKYWGQVIIITRRSKV